MLSRSLGGGGGVGSLEGALKYSLVLVQNTGCRYFYLLWIRGSVFGVTDCVNLL